MDVALLEGIAIATYESVGLDPSEPVSMFRLARLLHGPDVIVRAPLHRSHAATFMLNGEQRIALRRGVSAESANHLIGHELGHALLERERCVEDDVERACDYLGGALMAPRPAMRQLRMSFGDDYEEIAEAVCATHTWAALRVSEVTGVPTAVVAPLSVRVRGDAWGWPDTEERMRQFAKMPPLRGVRRTRLSDDRRRVVIAVEDAEAA